MINASFEYYRNQSKHKHYGRDLNNETFELAAIRGTNYADYFKIDKADSFNLKTTYPGLIIGAGYCHPAIEQGDFQLGFYFDHTTGMPVIPGSTVKGILKSIFPKDGDKDDIKKEKMKYINTDVIKDILKINGLELVDKKEEKNDWRRLFEKGNIFYDAYISDVPLMTTPEGKKIKGIFAEDYITPHHPEDPQTGIFKNPIPIRFLKIAPVVTFTFQFNLKDSYFENNQKITSKEKLKLFKKILLDFGIGAKRNVGYGNLREG